MIPLAYIKSGRSSVEQLLRLKRITHYNIYIATLVVRKNDSGKLILYDVVNIKKESETIFKL